MKKPSILNVFKGLCVATLAAAAGCQDPGPGDEVVGSSDQDLVVPEVIGAKDPQAVRDEYIVVYRAGVPAAKTGAAIQAMRSRGASILATYTVIPGFAARMTAAELDAVRADPDVAYIEANRKVSIDTIYNNPPFGLDRVDQRTGTNAQYDDLGFNGSGVHVYIIDTGIRTTHSEFTGRVGNGFSALDGDSSIQDCNGHGTHVASTAAGTRFGIAKGATVHPVRVLNCSGSGTTVDVVEGMDWVRANHIAPAVTNMSLGGPRSTAIDDAAASITTSGVTLVVAAGNSNADACGQSPASAPSALTVGATSPGEARAGFSNFGSCVDLFAPGVNVLGAGIANDTATATLSGTSMASPHVTGAVATYLQRFPLATVAQVSSAVFHTATAGVVGDPHGSPNRFLYTGFRSPQTSDILFRHTDSGLLAEWLMANGLVARVQDLFSPDAEVVGIGDFNGDGTSDILFRHPDSGLLAEWLMGNGTVAHVQDLFSPGAEVVGIGDFNGDGTSDILLRHTDSGLLVEWIMANGLVARVQDLFSPGAQVVGIGDFNGDGTSDILFRHTDSGLLAEWIMADGLVTRVQDLFSPGALVKGTGNFDGR
jgi:aqualysin 1